MDKLEYYHQVIEKVLIEYTKIPYSHGQIDTKLIIDKPENNYLLINIGWDGKRRVHGCLVHLEIIAGKIWIQRDGTEDGIANEIVAKGIPKEQIVLAFHPPEIRQYTEYAVT